MYQKKLFLLLWVFVYMPISVFSNTLSTDKEFYTPIVMDDITIMIPLRPAELISPRNNAKINGRLTMKFTKGTGVEKRLLKVYYENGTRQAISTLLTSDTFSVNLPKDGKYIDVTLRSYIADKYFIKKYRFRQSVGSSEVISPSQNAYLDNGMLNLRWSNGVNVSKRYIYVGTSGYIGGDIFKGYVSGNSKRFYGLPRNGEAIYVTIMSMISGKWYYQYYKYFATDVRKKAEKFVTAYLTNKTSTMRKITTQALINKLKTKNSLVRNYFSNIVSYHKLLYFHDYKAMVIGKMRDGKEITFYFSWDGTRWVLDSVV